MDTSVRTVRVSSAQEAFAITQELDAFEEAILDIGDADPSKMRMDIWEVAAKYCDAKEVILNFRNGCLKALAVPTCEDEAKWEPISPDIELTKNSIRDAVINRGIDFWGEYNGGAGAQFAGADPHVCCTAYAIRLIQKFAQAGLKADAYGFYVADNPSAILFSDDCDTEKTACLSNPSAGPVHEGHDFCVLRDPDTDRGRWIVDPWITDMEGCDTQGVYDLEDPDDAEKVAVIYGDPKAWGNWALDAQGSGFTPLKSQAGYSNATGLKEAGAEATTDAYGTTSKAGPEGERATPAPALKL